MSIFSNPLPTHAVALNAALIIGLALAFTPPAARAQVDIDLGVNRPFADTRYGLELYYEPLQQERVDRPLVAPLAMMTAGYFTGVVAAAVALGAWFSALQIDDYAPGERYQQRFDINDDGAVDRRDAQFSRRVARGFGVVSMLGMGVGIAGTVLFARRLARERAQQRTRFALDAEVSARALTVSLRRGF